MQGRDLGRPPVGAGGLLRLRRRHAPLRGRPGGCRRLPHRRPQCFYRPFGCDRRVRRADPTRTSVTGRASGGSRAGALAATRRARLAGAARRPDRRRSAAFTRLAGGPRPGFLLESVEHGERWGRFSFVGRAPVGARWSPAAGVRSPSRAALPDGGAHSTGGPGRLEALLGCLPLAPTVEELPPLHGGSSAISATTSSARSSASRTPPPDDVRLPRRRAAR